MITSIFEVSSDQKNVNSIVYTNLLSEMMPHTFLMLNCVIQRQKHSIWFYDFGADVFALNFHGYSF